MLPALFSKLKHIVAQFGIRFKLVKETHTSGRPKKIKDLDALTLALYQHQSTRMTKKSVYDDFKDMLFCSYKTLVVAMNKAGLYTSPQKLDSLLGYNYDHHQTTPFPVI